jgi:hypothetical protein
MEADVTSAVETVQKLLPLVGPRLHDAARDRIADGLDEAQRALPKRSGLFRR